jgi:thioredoxin 1
MSRIRSVDDATLDAELASAVGVVLVDFWAPWCGPCHAVAPTLDALADEYGEVVTVVKVNIDDNPSLARRFGIRSIPSVLVFREGQNVDAIVGAAPADVFRKSIERHLAEAGPASSA